MLISDLINILDTELTPELFKDYCPNGLQIDASFNKPINKIVSGVTACQLLIDEAVKHQADVLLVHHGFFWKSDSPTICGALAKKIATLFNHSISLITYHLPLDAHQVWGNNVQLAKILNWKVCGGLQPQTTTPIGNWGTVNGSAISLEQFAQSIETGLNRKPLCISAGDNKIKKIAWCTGAAQRMIKEALALGVDAFVSGEISEDTVHFARENNIHYISAGHHATERYGVQALGSWIQNTHGIQHLFIDINSPV
jgi:dinuclear metal center YbgI/SA1388 family protein